VLHHVAGESSPRQVAISVSRSTAQKVAMSLLAAVLVFITMFAVPAG